MLDNTATVFGPETLDSGKQLLQFQNRRYLGCRVSNRKNRLNYRLPGGSQENKHRTVQTRGFSESVGKEKGGGGRNLPGLKMSAEDPCIGQRARSLFQNVLLQY